MKQSKDYKEFMTNLHEFNKAMHELKIKLIDILNTMFSKLSEALRGDVVDASDLEVARE